MSKFSERRKAKMRKYRQRRVNRCCSHMIGCHIYDDNQTYEIIDQAKIKGVIYLLVEAEDNSYAIYKIVSVHQEVKLSPKKVLQNKKEFSNHVYWQEHSKIHINEDGKIESVEFGSIFGPKGTKQFGPNVIIIRIT